MIAAFLAVAALALPVARTDPSAPADLREDDAADRVLDRRCGPAVGFLWPGASRFCLGRPVEGALLGGLGAVELAGAIALLDQGGASLEGDGGPLVPLIAFQDAYVIGIGLTSIDLARAARRPYTPLDTLPELVSAPFRPAVLAKPGVAIGGAGLLGGALALTFAVDRPVRDRAARPNVLGLDLAPGLGYPLAAGVDAFTFLHVGIAEELVFRGVVQSTLARRLDPVAGWVLASLAFGAVHAPNALSLPADQRASYLLVSLPYITAAGFVLGGVYKAYGYSLQPPVAVHFWYDAVLTGVAFVIDPDDNPLSARVAFPF